MVKAEIKADMTSIQNGQGKEPEGDQVVPVRKAAPRHVSR
jgi:hypothetical protein